MINKKQKIILLLICLISFIPQYSHSNDAKLTDIIVTNTRDDLLLFLSVEGAFTTKMKEAILSGVPASFSFYIKLDQKRDLWLNKNIIDIKLTHTIKFNNLKKEFVINRSWIKNKPIITKSFLEAQKLISEIDGLKLVSLDVLEKGKRYRIRAKAKLKKITLPFYLHYILFVVSFWDFATDWYTVDFTY